jgi:NAD(P)-dependent dehydrogenase (short-subunit alcohol dehydrogenase family)
MEDQGKRLALVTGGAGMIGRAVAVELASRGWSLFLHHPVCDGREDQTLAAIEEEVNRTGLAVRVACGHGDLRHADARDLLVEQVLDSFGRIDMLVNAAAAGLTGSEDLLEMSEETYHEVMGATVTSTLFLTQLVGNEMVRLVESGELERPRIVTINSINAYTTSADQAPQCLSRAALSMMTKLFADRLGEHGIGVYEVRMGIVTSGSGDPVHSRYDALIADGLTPLRRWGRPGDVARAVAAIAEDYLAFSTGEVINVDGGFHLRRL